jgi:hypothetical protein
MGPGISEGSARAGAFLRLAQAEGTPPPYIPAPWIAYGGGEAILVVIVLLAVKVKIAKFIVTSALTQEPLLARVTWPVMRRIYSPVINPV